MPSPSARKETRASPRMIARSAMTNVISPWTGASSQKAGPGITLTKSQRRLRMP